MIQRVIAKSGLLTYMKCDVLFSQGRKQCIRYLGKEDRFFMHVTCKNFFLFTYVFPFSSLARYFCLESMDGWTDFSSVIVS